VTVARTSRPGDDGLSLLTGPGAADLLRVALAARGEELLSWRARQVHHQPGRSTTASYLAQVRAADGACRRRALGASAGLATNPDQPPGVVVLSGRAPAVAVWSWPLDPGLPALRSATDPASVRALLTACGVPGGPVTLRARGYRPRRRAVLEVSAGGRRLFLKVLRPSSVRGTSDRQRLLRDAGLPVPRVLGWSDDGLLALEALPGETLRARLRAGSGEVPDGPALLALLDRLPAGALSLPRRRSWTDAVDHYAAVVGRALPEEAERCAQLAGRVAALTTGAPAEEPAHGDLHDAQVLLQGRGVSGLLDVDTVGPGRRADDLACLLAHAEVLAQLQPGHGDATLRAAREWQRAFERAVEPSDLRARVAGVVVSLATGPHRAQEQGWPQATRARLDLAERWLVAAEE
jgi:aminoglycoside phosphotransferase